VLGVDIGVKHHSVTRVYYVHGHNVAWGDLERVYRD
jgi:hypothetical protein